MQTEETKNNGTKAEGTDFGCCNPENFQKMFKKMGKCFPGQGDLLTLILWSYNRIITKIVIVIKIHLVLPALFYKLIRHI